MRSSQWRVGWGAQREELPAAWSFMAWELGEGPRQHGAHLLKATAPWRKGGGKGAKQPGDASPRAQHASTCASCPMSVAERSSISCWQRVRDTWGLGKETDSSP